jgi:hypothetical protein
LYPAEVEHYRARRRIALGPGEQLLGEFASAAAARAAISQHFRRQEASVRVRAVVVAGENPRRPVPRFRCGALALVRVFAPA